MGRENKILLIEFLALLEFSQKLMQSMASNMKAYQSYQWWIAHKGPSLVD